MIKRRERERRARRLFQQKTRPPCPIQQARSRIAAVTAVRNPPPSSGPADFIFLNILRWDDLTQRPHHFATGLARRGYRVFWIDISFLPLNLSPEPSFLETLPITFSKFALPGLEGDVYRLG